MIERCYLALSSDLSVNFIAKEVVGKKVYVTDSVEGIDGEKTIYAKALTVFTFKNADTAAPFVFAMAVFYKNS